jgi:stage V sporulation protein SpoVS
MDKLLIKVAARSRPGAVAGFLACHLREHPVQVVEVRAIGKRATEVATIAISIAGGYVADDNLSLVTTTEVVPATVEPDKTLDCTVITVSAN